MLIDSCPGSLDSLVKTLVDNSHKTLKDFEEEIVGNDEILNLVNEINILIKKKINIKMILLKILKKIIQITLKN